MSKRVTRFALLALLLILVAAGYFIWQSDIWRTSNEPFVESFESAERWTVGEDANAAAAVENGQYAITVKAPQAIYFGNSDIIFADGVYAVTATQQEGPLDNGYGMILRADPDSGAFYLFEISGDGFVWLGYCESVCANQGWEASAAVNQGSGSPNQLRVEAEGAQFRFFVNDTLVGELNDSNLARGNIGVMVETFGQPGVRVTFDDFTVTPLDN